MDDDHQAYEFAHALYLARHVDGDAAQSIVEVAEAGLTSLPEATSLPGAMSGPISQMGDSWPS